MKNDNTIVEQNYETFFNLSSDFLFVLDMNGCIIEVNQTACKRLKYSLSELKGQSVLMLHPLERRKEAGTIVQKMLAGEAEFCQVPIISMDNVQIPVETRVIQGIWNGELALYGISRDISELRFSEEKFSKLFHINPSACGLSNLDDQKYIDVNEGFEKLLGFDKNETIGKTALELGIFSDETRKFILHKADKNGKVENEDANLSTKNGETKQVKLFAENIHVQNKKYRFTVVQDITELSQALKDLKESTDKYKFLFDKSNNAVFNVEKSSGKILGANKSAEQITGRSLEELKTLTIPDIAHDGAMHRLAELNKIKNAYRFGDIEYVRPDGSKRQALLSVTPIDDKQVFGVAIDITEAKLYEAEILNKNEELNAINSEQNKILSVISHDLRNPLGAISCLVKEMIKKYHSMPEEEIQELLEMINESTANTTRLLENLLEWAHIKRGKIDFEKEILLLDEIVDHSLETISESARQKDIKLTLEIPGNLKMSANRHMLETVFRNLASNAVKFTEKSGKIYISAKKKDTEFVEVSIKDTGIGMKKAMLENLFLVNQNVCRPGTDGESSTRLGLLLCKEFVEKLGGELNVNSEVGKGSEFVFTIPSEVIMEVAS